MRFSYSAAAAVTCILVGQTSASPLSYVKGLFGNGDSSSREGVFSLSNSHDLSHRPTVEESAVQLRKLVRSESFAELNTVYQDGPLNGSALGLLEYYADCDEDGSLTILMVKVGHQFKNWEAGSPISFSIKHSPPFGFSFSPASEPRASLVGSLSYIDTDDEDAISKAQSCFLHRHPDAKAWLPGNKVHDTSFMKFDVESVYWLGGFGNVAYIGDIPVDMYKNVTLEGHPKPPFKHPHQPAEGDDSALTFDPKSVEIMDMCYQVVIEDGKAMVNLGDDENRFPHKFPPHFPHHGDEDGDDDDDKPPHGPPHHKFPPHFPHHGDEDGDDDDDKPPHGPPHHKFPPHFPHHGDEDGDDDDDEPPHGPPHHKFPPHFPHHGLMDLHITSFLLTSLTMEMMMEMTMMMSPLMGLLMDLLTVLLTMAMMMRSLITMMKVSQERWSLAKDRSAPLLLRNTGKAAGQDQKEKRLHLLTLLAAWHTNFPSISIPCLLKLFWI
ncbi:pyridoxamine 5'-phosphate oxidase-domain-containing protein [Lipomyces oligophaga]|uniref:pyridoxamine 5'-phosphate oxidase-domain-containing protein n=1 Tax=Lipomyces oligophaga TaxID=45792 RepID=UPI0034CFF97B